MHQARIKPLRYTKEIIARREKTRIIFWGDGFYEGIVDPVKNPPVNNTELDDIIARVRFGHSCTALCGERFPPVEST